MDLFYVLKKCSRLTRNVFVIYTTIILISFLYLLHPGRNALYWYEYLKKDQIWEKLEPEISDNLKGVKFKNNNTECDYKSVLNDDTRLLMQKDSEINAAHKIIAGGEYIPAECKPKFSTAIIVPYRNRPEQLKTFLLHMHTFLRSQKIHYRIYIVEQMNNNIFKKANLINIGAIYAARHHFPCLIIHDVDLLPLQANNIYVCTKGPRHMASSIDKFRYALPYKSLFGGAVAILSKHFTAINGMSNLYTGWGGEDDDLYERIHIASLPTFRFDPAISKYVMLHHRDEDKGSRERNIRLLAEAATRVQTDGLNSLKFTEVSITLHPLFTHIMVDF